MAMRSISACETSSFCCSLKTSPWALQVEEKAAKRTQKIRSGNGKEKGIGSEVLKGRFGRERARKKFSGPSLPSTSPFDEEKTFPRDSSFIRCVPLFLPPSAEGEEGRNYGRGGVGVGGGGRKAGLEFIPHPLSSSQTQVLARRFSPPPSLGASLFSKVVAVLPRDYAQGESRGEKNLWLSPVVFLQHPLQLLARHLLLLREPAVRGLGHLQAVLGRLQLHKLVVLLALLGFYKDAKLQTRFPLLFFYRAEYEMPLTCPVSYSAPRGAISCVKMEGKEGRSAIAAASLFSEKRVGKKKSHSAYNTATRI